MNCLSVFDHFVELALKGLFNLSINIQYINIPAILDTQYLNSNKNPIIPKFKF